mgnify:CR=1 FL=1
MKFGDQKYGKIIGLNKVGENSSNSIRNVYCIDYFKFNLLRISQLCDKGNKLPFIMLNVIFVALKLKILLCLDLEWKMSMLLTLIMSTL